jgi:cytochrome c oxidase cbb3-type subunit 3/ubiquinol-cytochrome c reductase cytochrome c subunit
MRSRPARTAAITILLGLALAGCDSLPGRPKVSDQVPLPSQVMAFGALYGGNCAACHGADGRLGASRPLNDPVYLALVPRAQLRKVIASGVPGTLQPAFALSAGGTLTDAQIEALVGGVMDAWGKASSVNTADLPPYAGVAGNAARGKAVFASACAACHGPDGRGGPKGGAVADPSYLALVSDQYLRTTVIAGRTDLGMPDWRGYTPGQPLTPQQISDVVAWLIAQRRPVPGRPVSAPVSGKVG